MTGYISTAFQYQCKFERNISALYLLYLFEFYTEMHKLKIIPPIPPLHYTRIRNITCNEYWLALYQIWDTILLNIRFRISYDRIRRYPTIDDIMEIYSLCVFFKNGGCMIYITRLNIIHARSLRTCYKRTFKEQTFLHHVVVNLQNYLLTY